MIFDFYLPPAFRHFFVRVTLLLTLLLAGCGDVQGEAEAFTLRIDGRGSGYLAVQDGSGVWQPLTAASDTPHQVSVTDPQGRYGVLNVCLDAPTGNLSVNVQHGVVSQTPRVSAACLTDERPATVSVSGRVSGLSEGEYGNVYLGGMSALVDSAAPEGALELPAARYDLVASRYQGTARVPSRLVLELGLQIADAEVVTIDFRGPFSFRPEAAQLAIAGIRSGELLSGAVELVTRGGTAARVGEYTGGTRLAYARVPDSLNLSRGVPLRAEVQSFSYNDRTKAGSSRSLSRTLPNAPEATAQIGLPEPLMPPRLVVRRNSNVRPQASWQAHPAGGGSYTQFYSQIQAGHTVSYRLSQSSAWLAGRPLSYALPDFGALLGWQAEWNLIYGEVLFWDVSFTQKSPLKELFVSRSGVLTP